MSLRRAALVGLLVFTVIGLGRGAIQILIAPGAPIFGRRIGGALLATMIWVPVVVWAAWATTREWRRSVFIAVHGTAMLAMTVIDPLFVHWVWFSGGARVQVSEIALFIGRFDTNALFYIAVVAAAQAAYLHGAERAAARNASDLDTLLADAQLHVLTLQLHPHFLFNTLNLISQLAYDDLAAARRTLANLRALLVESLSHAATRVVALADELRFLDAYLEIQRARFRGRLHVERDVEPAALPGIVPHLFLQPLVENAVGHGLSSLASGGTIAVVARRNGERLLIRVEDDGRGVVTPVAERVGLANTRRRLAQLFRNDHVMAIRPRSPRGTVVSIDIPFRTAGARPPAENDSADSIVLGESLNDRSRKVPSFVTIAACWAVIALIWTELELITQTAIPTSATRLDAILADGSNALLWALLTPAVLWMSRRVDLSETFSIRTVGCHLVGAVATTVVHLGIWFVVLRQFIPADFAGNWDSVLAWGMWDVFAYGAIVAFGTIVNIAARRRERTLTTLRTRAELSKARAAAMRLRLQPGVLLAALDAIDTQIARDAVRAEAAIARIGDLLRALLATCDIEEISVSEEIDLLRAFTDVVNRQPVEIEADGALDVTLPAMIVTPLVAALGGAVASIRFLVRDMALAIELRAGQGVIDRHTIDEVEARLGALFGGRASLVVTNHTGLNAIDVTVPLAAGAPSTLPALAAIA